MKLNFKNRFLLTSSIAFFLAVPFCSVSEADVNSFNFQARPFSVLSKINHSANTQVNNLSNAVPVQNDNVVGNLSGSFSVSPAGSATYDIPIKVSPGTAGLAPNLSLHYDSSGGNSVLGMGFSLAGLTTITRVNQNYTQNGKIHGVNFTNDDRFALNGQQLVAISGNYGADGAEYRTYIDSQARIFSKGVAGNGPASFIVQTKGGQTAYYGESSESQVTVNDNTSGTVVNWLLDKIEDQSGNYIQYHYNNDQANGAAYLTEIDYTGNDQQNLKPYNQVKFIYEARPDAILAYQAGTKFNTTQRLTEIQTYCNGTLVYDYKINYEYSPNTFKSRITSIQECDGQGECLRPLTFTWQTNQPGWTEVTDAWSPRVPIVNLGQRPRSDNGVRFISTYNNGLPEMVYAVSNSFRQGPSASGAWKATPSGWQDDNQFAPKYPIVYEHSADPKCNLGAPGVQFIDSGGMGRDDLIQSLEYMIYRPENINAARATDQGWSDDGSKKLPQGVYLSIFTEGMHQPLRQEPERFSLIGDLFGTGRSGILQSVMGERAAVVFNGSNWQSIGDYIPPVDFAINCIGVNGCSSNGAQLAYLTDSGLPDLIVANDNQRAVWINSGDSNDPSGSAWHPASAFNPPDSFRFVVNAQSGATKDGGGREVSLLGDGLTDLVVGYHGNDHAWINTGAGFIPDNDYNLKADVIDSNDHDDGVVFEDITGSGLPAMLQCSGAVNGGVCRAWLNEHGQWVEHDEFKLPIQVTDGSGQDNGVRFVDLLGTGFPDIVFNNGSSKDAWLNNAQIKPDIITNIQDALGDNLQITYRPITDSSVYTRGNSAQYPNADVQAPIWVVAQTASDTVITPIPNVKTVYSKIAKLINANDTQHVTLYRYSNAEVNQLGLGFLGFAAVQTTDQATGVSVTTFYSQDTAHHTEGMPNGSETSLNGVVINKQTVQFDLKTYGNGQVNQTYYFPYGHVSTEDAYDTDGTLLSEKTTTTDFDDYGNPTQIAQTTKDNTNTYADVTVNQYDNVIDQAHWWLGQLKSAKVTASAPNTADIIRSTSYTYEPDTGLLHSSTSYTDIPDASKNQKGNASEKFLMTTYIHDGYGNVKETDITGSDIAPRSESAVYDPQERFIISKTNALNQTVQFQYDERFGEVTQTTDANHLVEINHYDNFGRLTSTLHPDGTTSAIQYRWSSTDQSAPTGSVYEVVAISTGEPVKVSYHDELDREIGQAMQGFNGKWIWQLTNYDELGRVVGKTTPFYPGDNIYETSNQYDALGRVILTTNPDGTTIHIAYKGFTTTTTNPKNQSTTKTVNLRGDLIDSTDAQGHHTTYQYDAFDDLVKMIDSKSNVTTMQYDNQSHKIAMHDLDRGKWSYQYDALGEMTEQLDPLNNETTFKYDLLGRVIAKTDPAGTSTWQYDTAANGVGKLASENGVSNLILTAIGNTNGSSPSGRGDGVRVVKMQIAPPNSFQKLQAAKNNLVSYSKYYQYDQFSRPSTVTTVLNGQSYIESMTYDSATGKLQKIIYPNQLAILNHYDAAGYLTQVTNADTGQLYSQINAMDAVGHVLSETHSNGLITNYTYDPASNFLMEIETVPSTALTLQQNVFGGDNKNKADQWHLQMAHASSPVILAKAGIHSQSNNNTATPVQALTYQYDSLGNVTEKDDAVLNVKDHYDYDELNRLKDDITTDNSHQQSSTLSYTYDELGNIQNKSDVGNYTYAENAGPHAVTSISGGGETDSFKYDASGNQTHADMQTANGHIIRDISYTSFDVAKAITQTNDKANSSATVNFYYDANRSRFMREDVSTINGVTTKTTTLYLDGEEIDTTVDSSGTHNTIKNYIGDTEIDNTDGTVHRYDILKDNIDSTSLITDENGNVVQRFHYDPFGEQQLVTTAAHVILAKAGIQAVSSNPTSITHYGFTGQEEVNAGGIDLIHMNGRMYDPHLGRFLSADPTIQDPSNSQCLNRYSYCVNNPICYTDPTGFSWWSHLWKGVKHLFHDIGHAIVSALRNPVVGSLLMITASAIAIWATGGLAAIGLGHAVSAIGAAEWYAGAAAVSGAVSYARTGNLGQGLLSAAESFAEMYAWNGIGSLDGKLFGNASGAWFGESWVHGVAGGGMAAIEGGSFKDGFIASAASQALSGPINGIGKISADDEAGSIATIAERGAAAAVVGGTVAAMTGGNIENGAMTSAYGEMFNDASDALGQSLVTDSQAESAFDSDALNYGANHPWTAGGMILSCTPVGDVIEGAGLVIGRLADLEAGPLGKSEYTLLSKMTEDLGSPQANWARNSSLLRAEMSKGMSIRDASASLQDTDFTPSGKMIRQTFLGMERNLLRNRGWGFDGRYWNPPK